MVAVVAAPAFAAVAAGGSGNCGSSRGGDSSGTRLGSRGSGSSGTRLGSRGSERRWQRW